MVFWVLLVRLLIRLNLRYDVEDINGDLVVTLVEHILHTFIAKRSSTVAFLMHTMALSTQFDFRITCRLAMSLLCMKLNMPRGHISVKFNNQNNKRIKCLWLHTSWTSYTFLVKDESEITYIYIYIYIYIYFFCFVNSPLLLELPPRGQVQVAMDR